MFKLRVAIMIAWMLGSYYLANGQTEGFTKLDSNCYQWACGSSFEKEKPIPIMLNSGVRPKTTPSYILKYGKRILKLNTGIVKLIDPTWIKRVQVSNDKKLTSKYGESGTHGIVLIELYDDKLSYVLNAMDSSPKPQKDKS